MTVPHPPDDGSDPGQDESLPKGRSALGGSTPANDASKPVPAGQRGKEPQPDGEQKTEVEIDRIEAYLRGPTAFTA